MKKPLLIVFALCFASLSFAQKSNKQPVPSGNKDVAYRTFKFKKAFNAITKKGTLHDSVLSAQYNYNEPPHTYSGYVYSLNGFEITAVKDYVSHSTTDMLIVRGYGHRYAIFPYGKLKGGYLIQLDGTACDTTWDNYDPSRRIKTLLSGMARLAQK